MPLDARAAVRRYYEAEAVKRGEDAPAEEFRRVPNRALIRKFRFGGEKHPVKAGDGVEMVRPKRSRITRGVRGRKRRGQMLTNDGPISGFSDYVANGPWGDV